MSEVEGDLTNLTEIGQQWGLTNRELGDHLTNAGYREDGRPTALAIEKKIAEVIYSGDYPRYYWSRRGVEKFLDEHKLKRKCLWRRTDKQFYVVTPLIF